jgi:hypothetical protein
MRSFTLALLLVAAPSFAQTSPKPKVQNVEFTPTDIEAKPEMPLGGYYGPPVKPKFDCLIKVRVNFNDKLADSVHER